MLLLALCENMQIAQDNCWFVDAVKDTLSNKVAATLDQCRQGIGGVDEVKRTDTISSIVVSVRRLELSQCHSKPPSVVEPIPSQKSLQPTSSLSTPSLLQSHCPLPFASETYQSFYVMTEAYCGTISRRRI